MVNRTLYRFSRIFMITALGLVAGCSQPMRTLIDFNAERDAQAAQVARQRADFAMLLRDVEKGRLKTGTRLSSVINRYGAPIIKEGGVLLYRDPVNFLNSDKVYLVFDENDKLEDMRIELEDGE